MTTRFNDGKYRIGNVTTVGEDEVAVGAQLILPRIQSCQGIVLALANGLLLAYHATVHTSDAEVEDGMAMLDDKRSSEVGCIYLVGTFGQTSPLDPQPNRNIPSWVTQGPLALRWPKAAKTLRKRFGKCLVYAFDKGQNQLHLRATASGARAILEYRLQQVNELPTAGDSFTYIHPSNLLSV